MATDRQPFRLGVSSFVTDRWMTPTDVGTFGRSPATSVELAAPSIWRAPNQAVRETVTALRASGLELWSVHSPFMNGLDLSTLDEAVRARTLAAIREAFGLAGELGCAAVVVHPSSEPIAPLDRAARLEQSRSSLAAVCNMARESGTRAALEPLPRTCLANRADEVADLLEGLPAQDIGICLDVNHANVGQDLVAFIQRFGSRIITLHISDNDGIDEKHWLPGIGVIDWPAVMKALRAAGYVGPLVYEVGRGDASLAERLEEFGRNQQWLLSLMA